MPCLHPVGVLGRLILHMCIVCLQQELGGAVICTQPRRLAVVAIAGHVAELVGCQLGQDVGFRIGQRSIASRRTSIMFTTSGFLLEDLRANVSASELVAASTQWHACLSLLRGYPWQLPAQCGMFACSSCKVAPDSCKHPNNELACGICKGILHQCSNTEPFLGPARPTLDALYSRQYDMVRSIAKVLQCQRLC